MIVAQQFTAGLRDDSFAVREADGWMITGPDFSVVRFTDFVSAPPNPSDESLGYFRSSANADSVHYQLVQRASMIVFALRTNSAVHASGA